MIKSVQNTHEIAGAASEMLEALELIYLGNSMSKIELPLMYNMLINELEYIQENENSKLYIVIDEKCLDYLLLK